MEIKYATKWLEGKLASDAAAYQGRVLGIEIARDLEKTLKLSFLEERSPLREMKVLPYNQVFIRGAAGNVELKLEPETNEFKDYATSETPIRKYRSAITLCGEEKTLEQLAGILEKYKDNKVK